MASGNPSSFDTRSQNRARFSRVSTDWNRPVVRRVQTDPVLHQSHGMNGDHSLYGRADGDTACGDDPQRLYALDPGLAKRADDSGDPLDDAFPELTLGIGAMQTDVQGSRDPRTSASLVASVRSQKSTRSKRPRGHPNLDNQARLADSCGFSTSQGSATLNRVGDLSTIVAADKGTSLMALSHDFIGRSPLNPGFNVLTLRFWQVHQVGMQLGPIISCSG